MKWSPSGRPDTVVPNQVHEAGPHADADQAHRALAGLAQLLGQGVRAQEHDEHRDDGPVEALAGQGVADDDRDRHPHRHLCRGAQVRRNGGPHRDHRGPAADRGRARASRSHGRQSWCCRGVGTPSLGGELDHAGYDRGARLYQGVGGVNEAEGQDSAGSGEGRKERQCAMTTSASGSGGDGSKATPCSCSPEAAPWRSPGGHARSPTQGGHHAGRPRGHVNRGAQWGVSRRPSWTYRGHYFIVYQFVRQDGRRLMPSLFKIRQTPEGLIDMS